MWRLLLAEREYTPLPLRWHVWHILVASSAPLVAWWYFARVRKHMTLAREENVQLDAVLVEAEAVKKAEEDRDLRDLVAKVAALESKMEQLNKPEQVHVVEDKV